MSRTNQVGNHRTTVSTDHNGTTSVVYHQTAVVRFDRHSILLDTGGYETRTTKLRMNQTSQQFGLGYHVYQENWQWYVNYHGTTYTFDGQRLELYRQGAYSDVPNAA